MFRETAHIKTMPVFDAAASNSQLSWKFTDDQGRNWKGVASVVPGAAANPGMVATMKLSLAS
jgi:hypothetical protein